jgi:hypothetical protein
LPSFQRAQETKTRRSKDSKNACISHVVSHAISLCCGFPNCAGVVGAGVLSPAPFPLPWICIVKVFVWCCFSLSCCSVLLDPSLFPHGAVPFIHSFIMTKSSLLALSGLLHILVVDALNAPLPAPTDNLANALGLGLGFDPVPTAAPMLPRDLVKRAGASPALIGYYAPDNTCGYVSGIQGKFTSQDVPARNGILIRK